jgi:RES domain-containing protein
VITAWRIVKKRHATAAFDGDGARRFGGRWNSPGIRMVYVASTRSLAALELAVHLDRSTVLSSFVLIPCEFDERLVTRVSVGRLPADWRRDPAPPELARIGDTWANAATSAALEVPSAIIEQEMNYLLNPRHPDFPKISIGKAADFEFDARLIK